MHLNLSVILPMNQSKEYGISASVMKPYERSSETGTVPDEGGNCPEDFAGYEKKTYVRRTLR